MSIFDIVNPVEKAKAAIAEAEQAKAEQYAKPAIDAMNAAVQAAQLAQIQASVDAATKAANDAAAAAVKWKQTEETIEDALEHAGISGVDVQIDGKGFAKLVGNVASDNDQQTAVAMVEHYNVTGLDSQLQVVPPPPPEPAPPAPAAGAGPVHYKVKAGESWWGMAAKFYGDGTLWKELKAANNNPKMIYPGSDVIIPEKSALKK